jgi:hypothetical protein
MQNSDEVKTTGQNYIPGHRKDMLSMAHLLHKARLSFEKCPDYACFFLVSKNRMPVRYRFLSEAWIMNQL